MRLMVRFLDWPLRLKMAVLLVAASVIPLAAAALLDIREARRLFVDHASALLKARGDQLVEELDTFHRGYGRAAQKFARLRPVVEFCGAVGGDREQLRQAVHDVLQVHPNADPIIRGAGLLDLAGTVIVATEQALVGKNLAFHRYVREARHGEVTISDIYFAEPEVGQVPTVAYLAPVLGSDQKPIGFMALWVKATALWDIAKGSNALAGAGSFAVLFNHEGVRIAHTYNQDIVFHPGGVLEPAVLEAFVAERSFGENTRELLTDVRAFPEQFERARAESPGRDVFRGFAPVNQKWNYGVARRFQTVPWTLFYMIPEASLEAQIAKMTSRKMFFAGAIILVALAAGTLFAAVILRPIRALSTATGLLASGDLGIRVSVGRGDEIGRLGESFNAMAAQVQAQAQTLRQTNDSLEQKVQNRTAELVQTAKNLEAENSERKRAEAALRESEQSLATTLDSIGDAVIATDTQGNIVRMNPVAEGLTGWSFEEARGRPLSDVFRIVNEDTRKTVENPTVRVLREGVIVGLANHTALISRSGSECPIADSGAPIRDPKGEICGVVLVFRDQTEERRLEAMRLKNVRLELENRQTQEASRLKSEFLANMSHELRTPLNSIIGFSQLLHDGEVGPLAAKQEEFLGDILTSGRHLLQLINDVLDLSKVEAGKMDFHPEAVDLSRLFSEVTSILRTTAANKQIRIETSASELEDIVLDAARLKQVLYNYLSNALKFTPQGGTVTVRAVPEGSTTFRLEVEDSGIGIAAEDISRLFIEFQQLDAGATKKHAGTGLGLALTKRLVEAQGGTVGVRSKVGVGSVFHVILPRRATAAPLGTPHIASVTNPRAPSVLVVEDNPADQVAIARVLEDVGYSVEVASSGIQAIALCESRVFDAITLDLILPDMSGLDVLRTLRSEGANQGVPVVVLTVVTERATGGFAVHDVLSKPVNGTSLLASLRKAGVAPEASGKLWVIDDDPGSLKLMAAMLEQLGYQSTSFIQAEIALETLRHERPLAIILDLLMPGVDGFEFLAQFRRDPENSAVPVLVWTIKDVSGQELERLRASAQAVIQKGAGAANLAVALRSFLETGGIRGAEQEQQDGG